MGYVRIMISFTFLVMALVTIMAWYTKSLGNTLQAETEPSPLNTRTSLHHKVNTELLVMYAFQFTLIFLCYGVARMICQPWMWKLHFWTVLGLTAAAAAQVVHFVWLVSPGIPSFSAVMALPP